MLHCAPHGRVHSCITIWTITAGSQACALYVWPCLLLHHGLVCSCIINVTITAGSQACAVCGRGLPRRQQGAEGVCAEDWHPSGLHPHGSRHLPRQ